MNTKEVFKGMATVKEEIKDLTTKLENYKNINYDNLSENSDFEEFVGIEIYELINKPEIIDKFNIRVDYFENTYKSSEYKKLAEKIQNVIFAYEKQILPLEKIRNEVIDNLINSINEKIPDVKTLTAKFKKSLTYKEHEKIKEEIKKKARKYNNSSLLEINNYLLELMDKVYCYNSFLRRKGVSDNIVKPHTIDELIDNSILKPLSLIDTIKIIKDEIPRKIMPETLNDKKNEEIPQFIHDFRPCNFLSELNIKISNCSYINKVLGTYIYTWDSCENVEYENIFTEIQRILLYEPTKLKVSDFKEARIIIFTLHRYVREPFFKPNSTENSNWVNETNDFRYFKDFVVPIKNTLEELIGVFEAQSKSESQEPQAEPLSTEIILFYNDKNKKIKIENVDYSLSEVEYETLKIFIDNPNKKIQNSEIQDNLQITAETTRRRIITLKNKCPELKKYIPNASKHSGGYILELQSAQIACF